MRAMIQLLVGGRARAGFRAACANPASPRKPTKEPPGSARESRVFSHATQVTEAARVPCDGLGKNSANYFPCLSSGRSGKIFTSSRSAFSLRLLSDHTVQEFLPADTLLRPGGVAWFSFDLPLEESYLRSEALELSLGALLELPPSVEQRRVGVAERGESQREDRAVRVFLAQVFCDSKGVGEQFRGFVQPLRLFQQDEIGGNVIFQLRQVTTPDGVGRSEGHTSEHQ